jgi:hypothetical protein
MSEAQNTGSGPAPTPAPAGEPQGTLPTGATPTDPTPTGAPAPGTAPATPPAPGESAEIVYEFKAPDGVELGEGDLNEFKTIAKDLKLPLEHAQKLVDLAAKREQARAEVFATTVAGWAEQTTNDKELGKPENLAMAQKAVETFGSPELKLILNSSGLGSHPEVVRAFLKIGKAISEDAILGKGAGGSSTRSHADVLYGTPAN